MAAPHVVIVPSAGIGHLTPVAEFAKRLVRQGITATIVTIDASSRSNTTFLEELPQEINFLNLPEVSLDDLPPDTIIETLIFTSITRSIPALRLALVELKETTNLVAFVADVFGVFYLKVAKELGIRPYIFYTTTATVLSLALHLHQLDERITEEYRDLKDPIQLPGCIPLRGTELVSVMQDRKSDSYAWFLKVTAQYHHAEGIFINSFESIEEETIKALKANSAIPPVYPVGPLVHDGGDTERDSSGCLTWLDQQPPGSVLFVSFGSGGTLTSAQLTELALGLEVSGQRFLWVSHSPSDTSAHDSYFNVAGADDQLTFLPEGFLERTKAVGKVVFSWAPQVKVLRHSATGGFLTHCGWNSVLESIVHGVPMIAWPLFAEQKMNAALMVEGAKVAVRAMLGEKGVVEREEVARVVKSLMEGEEGKIIRERLSRIREEGSKGLIQGGASYEALVTVAEEWKRSCTFSH